MGNNIRNTTSISISFNMSTTKLLETTLYPDPIAPEY